MEHEEKGFTLMELIKAMLHYWYIIAISTVLGVLLGFGLAFYVVAPKYSSTAEVLVQARDINNNYTFLESQRAVETLVYLFTSDVVLDQVIEDLGVQGEGLTGAQIKSNLSISYKTTSLFIRITYTDLNKDITAPIVNQVVDTAKRLADDGVTSPLLQNTFTIVNNGNDGRYASPNKPLYLVIGFLLGAIVGAGIVLIIEFSRTTYRTKEEIEKDLNIPVIGVIPEFNVEDE
ncbi:MAG: Wzz/FepE/Etk N-terminal domain-containing protein [Acholeplasmataceae bacterium]|nr:Wzz/FepE/Etk N-terminal domain-containing protein [Acholeplasmataceae bacterium]